MKKTHQLIVSLLAVLLLPALLWGADSKKDSKKEELRQRIRERAAQIEKFKEDGVIGETDDGYLDYVEKKDAKAADVVKAENDDRKSVYEIVAKDTGESVDKVARQAAQKRFDHARPGEYLRYDGKWRKKA